MRITTLIVALPVVTSLAVGWSGQAGAQAATPPSAPPGVTSGPLGRISGSAELGGRTFLDGGLTPQQLGKFSEYKSVPSGTVLNSLMLRYTPADSFRLFQVTGERLGQLDQTVAARIAQPGLFDFHFQWDRIPHVYSTTARMLGSRPTPDYLSLAGVPRGDTNSVNRALDALNQSNVFLGPVRTGWSPIKASLSLSPSAAWDSRVEYTRVSKVGDRPMGMSMGNSPSLNSREILEPIDQTTHDLKLTQGYAVDRFQVVVSYDLSMFRNGYQSVTADNPLNATDSPVTSVGSARGRNALAPNNMAQTVVATGALNLPYQTRINGSASYSAWDQSQAFIPATINSAVAASPLVANAMNAMPKNLGGRAGTSTVSLGLNSRPLSKVTVSGHYRRYQYRDAAAADSVPILIINDRMPTSFVAAAAERDPFTRENADLGATWRVLGPVSFVAAVGRDAMMLANEERNTQKYTERTAQAGINVTGNQWASLRTMYSKGWRRDDGYHQADASYMADFRRLDLANRDRERLSVIADVTPLDQVTVSGTWKIGRDEYPNSLYGVQSDHSTMVGGDVDWAPTNRVSLGGGWSREEFRNIMRARYRSGTVDLPVFDWVANNHDLVTIGSLYLNAIVVPDRVEAGGTFQVSHSRTLMAAYNPQTPAGGTESMRVQGTAVDFPMITQNMQPLNTFVRMKLTADWAATLRYQSEMFGQYDFRNVGQTYALSQMFLGNMFQNYNAKFVTITLTYRPGAIRVGRSTI